VSRDEYLLTLLLEECAEIQQAASKALRFGMDDNYKDNPTNREKLHQEIQDVLAVIDLLTEAEVFATNPSIRDPVRQTVKRARIEHYMRYSQEMLRLQ
jgi:hypothetical protein